MTTPRTRKATEPEPEEHLPVDGRMMRRLHGLLTAHGIPSADKGRHDYLTAEVGRPITSASELTRTETARLIAELEADDAPEVHTLTGRSLTKLRAEFPPEAIGKLPRITCRACRDSQRKRCDEHTWVARCPACGNSHSSAAIHLDYVGHADVTDRLLEVDPTWTYRPFTGEELAAIPPSMRNGLWIWLTVCGVTRPGFGDAGDKNGGNAVKEAIGDALRNAGMRFGVALALWAKGDREWAHAEKSGAEDEHADAPPPREPQAPAPGPDAAALIRDLTGLAARQGTDLAGITGKFREAHGGITVEQLVTEAPVADLVALVQQIETYIATHPPAENIPA